MSDINEENEANLARESTASTEGSDAPLLETRVRVDGAFRKRIFKANQWVFILIFVFGGVLTLGGIVGVVLYYLTKNDFSEKAAFFLFLGVLLLICGGVAASSAKRGVANADKNVKESVSRFYRYYFVETIYRYTEKVGEIKRYYREFSGVRETKEFIYLNGVDGSFFPVDKLTLTQEQIEVLRGLFVSPTKTL